MDHRIGRMEERYRDENIHYSSSSVSSERRFSDDLNEDGINDDDNISEPSTATLQDAACWRFIYSAVQPESEELSYRFLKFRK